MRTIVWLLLATLFSASAILKAQVSQGGAPTSFTKTHITDQVPTVTMPAVDVAALLAEDEQDMAKGEPFRFGTDLDVNIGLGNSGVWSDLKGGDRIWRVAIKSSGAYSLNLIFDQFYMPTGASMFVYTADKQMVIGAFTSFNNKEHGKFSTTVLKGDEIVIEYFEPAEVKGLGRLNVNKVIHAYKPTFFKGGGSNRGFGDSGGCNNNVACPVSVGWENEINASLMYLLGNNTRICSGSMLNNVLEDGTPYFLSANHCYSGDFATWIFMFNYQSPTCTPNADGPTNQTVSGSTLRSRRTASDFMLFELSVQPPLSYNVYYAGWSNVNVAPTSAVGIHHPANDVKKISFENDALVSSGYFSSGNDHWRVNDWDDGTTEGGSSGSPLFDQNHRVVGQLHGGSAACGNNAEDYYGKFASSWLGGGSPGTQLSYWLDPNGSGATVLDGLSLSVPAFTADVSLVSITGIDASSCDRTAEGTLSFSNQGSDLLSNVEFDVYFDGASQGTVTWTGSLAFLQSATVALPSISNIATGQHTIEVIVYAVNASTDLNPLNDTISFDITVQQGEQLDIELITDNFGDETTIYLYDSDNNVVLQESGFSDGTTYDLGQCLPCGCYSFVITDSESDGICCFYGNGSYTITLPDGTVAATGGNFTDQETVNFCVQSSSAPTVSISAPDTVYVGDVVPLFGTATSCASSVNWAVSGGSLSSTTTESTTVTFGTEGTYTISFDATNSIGNASENHTIVVLSANSSRALAMEQLNWTLFPNPVNDQLNLSFNNAGEYLNGAKLVMVNTIGVQVKQVTVTDSQDMNLDVADLPSGLYLVELRLNDGSRSQVKRFVKN